MSFFEHLGHGWVQYKGSNGRPNLINLTQAERIHETQGVTTIWQTNNDVSIPCPIDEVREALLGCIDRLHRTRNVPLSVDSGGKPSLRPTLDDDQIQFLNKAFSTLEDELCNLEDAYRTARRFGGVSVMRDIVFGIRAEVNSWS